MELQTPWQRMAGRGHLRGLSPDERTAGLQVAENALDVATGVVPIVGTGYQVASEALDGEYRDAALAGAAAAVGLSPAALRKLLARIHGVADDAAIADDVAGIASLSLEDIAREAAR